MVALVLLAACQRDPEVEAPQLVMHGGGVRPPPAFDDAGVADAIIVQRELTTRITSVSEAKPRATVIVTIDGGADEGITLEWTGSIVDEQGAEVGPYTILEVAGDHCVGSTTLARKQLDGKRVRLRSPAP